MPPEHNLPSSLHHTARRLAWSRVLTLAIAAFVFNTTEFTPIALLSDIGAGFGMSAAQTGVMLTVYAWVVSLASLPCMLLLTKLERRGLLLALFTLFIASHVLSALAWNFGVLLVSRIGVALAHAIFWAITTALAVRLAPPGKQQQAIGWLSMGTALATVLGLPLGRLIGQWLGWRATFALIAIAAAAVMLAVFLLLPRRPLLLGLYAFTALIIAAHFTAYSYIEPFASQFSHLGEGATTALLLVFGLSGMVASVLFARLHTRMPTRFLTCAIALLCAALLLLRPLGASPPALFALVFCWGIGIAALGLALIVRVLRLAPDATDVATAIYSGIYNIGIGGGALIGRLVMQHGDLAFIGLAGAALALAGSVLFACVQWRFRTPR
ncbi:sugar transporter [uncultured Cardiobacterium sp.]|uniref:sugar transporter n=1 Tax=uncultured Cardiobacterium sp. TaxID=417619 RepID=UPI003420BA49